MNIDEGALQSIRDKYDAFIAPSVQRELIEAYETAKAAATEQQPRDWEADYDAAMCEIHEIIRVARDNPTGLTKFLKLNFPGEWRITKDEHKALFDSPESHQMPDGSPIFGEDSPHDIGEHLVKICDEQPQADRYNNRSHTGIDYTHRSDEAAK